MIEDACKYFRMFRQNDRFFSTEDRPLGEVVSDLATRVRVHQPPAVGAFHVACADESEGECIDAFQRGLVDPLLPSLKHACHAPFRLRNLGARYEPGAIGVAEHHYATPETADAFKVLVCKINGHVAATGTGPDVRFGQMQRYHARSVACGALHAMLDGVDLPALSELREAFATDGIDRIGALNDPQRVPPQYRSLALALASTGLQSRRLVEDIRKHTPHTPTIYLIASCVTLNRPEDDTEILAGITALSVRAPGPTEDYVGLGDDPAAYRYSFEDGRIRVSEDV